MQYLSSLINYFPLNGTAKRPRLGSLGVVVMLMIVLSLFMACGKRPITFSNEERQAADSVVRATRGVDSLAQLQQRLADAGNRLGSIVTLREWGKLLRNESRFEEALRVHSQGLSEAEAIGDTIEWVQALNNIGTDYRRMGILDVAQEYHYNAWKLSEECADTAFQAKKIVSCPSMVWEISIWHWATMNEPIVHCGEH